MIKVWISSTKTCIISTHNIPWDSQDYPTHNIPWDSKDYLTHNIPWDSQHYPTHNIPWDSQDYLTHNIPWDSQHYLTHNIPWDSQDYPPTIFREILSIISPTIFREILRIIHPQYSVRFSELTAITSLNGIKSFVLLTEKQWIFNSPGMLRYVGFQIFTDVSEDCNAFFFQGQVV
jgi:hypothetical protein